MKYLYCLLILTFFTGFLFAQNKQVVYALRLSEGDAKQLPTTINPAFFVENGSILWVNAGWEIFVDERARVFVLRPERTSFTAASVSPQFSERKEAQFRTFCFCPPNASGNCKHTYENVGNDEIVRCEGSCACNSFTIFEPEECPPQMMSPTGNWFDSNCR